MAKKQDSLYFNSFIKCTDFSCQAAHMLEETMADFDVEKMADRMEAIHTIEPVSYTHLDVYKRQPFLLCKSPAVQRQDKQHEKQSHKDPRSRTDGAS